MLWRKHCEKLDALVTYCPTCCQGFIAQKDISRDEVIFECGKTAGREAAKKLTAQATQQAPAQATPAYKDSTPELHIGDSAFESWYSTYSPAHKSDKQRARDAYAAGMGDPLVTAAPAAVAGPSDPSITLDFKMASVLLDMFGGEPGLVTLQHGGEKCHSGAGLYAWHSDLPEEGANFLGAEPHHPASAHGIGQDRRHSVPNTRSSSSSGYGYGSTASSGSGSGAS